MTATYHPTAGSRFDIRDRYLINTVLPRWIDTARGMDCGDVVFVLETQRDRLIEGVVGRDEVRKDVDRARAALFAELMYRVDEDDEEV